jgi:hypothetical protein
MVEISNYVQNSNKIIDYINGHIKNSNIGMICLYYNKEPVNECVLNYVEQNIFETIANYFDARIISIIDTSNENTVTIDCKMDLNQIILHVSLYHKREENELIWIDVIINRL